jgi:hypothetical protein
MVLFSLPVKTILRVRGEYTTFWMNSTYLIKAAAAERQ